MRFRLPLLTIFVALAVLAPAANARVRHASPTGIGTTCTQVAPCDLQTAMSETWTGDEVIIAPGDYALEEFGAYVPWVNAELTEFSHDIYVHGEFDAPPPTIHLAADEYSTLSMAGEGDRLSWVDVTSSGAEATAIFCECAVDRVRALATGADSIAISSGPGSITNSLALATGKNGTGAFMSSSAPGYTGSVLSSTVIATGPESEGVISAYFGSGGPEEETPPPGTFTTTVVDSIVDGTESDLNAAGGASDRRGVFVASNSNFQVVDVDLGTYTDGGGNQTAAPLFVDAAAGNFAEAAGSPTIDAGTAYAGIGPVDLAGNPRSQGGATDIGAFEAVPPPAPGVLKSLKVAPAAFKAANIGGAIISAKGKKAKAPIGAKVSFSLDAAGPVKFSVARPTIGRKAGKKCVKKSHGNAGKPKCKRLAPLKGGFTIDGSPGANSFKFAGRIRNRSLKPGKYALVGSAGGVTKSAKFKIVR